MQTFDAFVFRHGVIADDERLQEQVFREVLTTFSIEMSHDDYRTFFAGRTDEEGFERFAVHYPDLATQTSALLQMKNRAYRHYSGGSHVPYEGVGTLLDALVDAGRPVAVISGSNREELSEVLESLGMQKVFDVAVTSDDLTENDGINPYVLVGQRMGVDPARCIAFEHSPAGVAAANDAGTRCVAVTLTHDPEELLGADEVVPTVYEWMIRNEILGVQRN